MELAPPFTTEAIRPARPLSLRQVLFRTRLPGPPDGANNFPESLRSPNQPQSSQPEQTQATEYHTGSRCLLGMKGLLWTSNPPKPARKQQKMKNSGPTSRNKAIPCESNRGRYA